ncbi:MAG: hypothetical protein BJ554DRAFT_8441, partial [Olpidium bornovanus]
DGVVRVVPARRGGLRRAQRRPPGRRHARAPDVERGLPHAEGPRGQLPPSVGRAHRPLAGPHPRLPGHGQDGLRGLRRVRQHRERGRRRPLGPGRQRRGDRRAAPPAQPQDRHVPRRPRRAPRRVFREDPPPHRRDQRVPHGAEQGEDAEAALRIYCIFHRAPPLARPVLRQRAAQSRVRVAASCDGGRSEAVYRAAASVARQLLT